MGAQSRFQHRPRLGSMMIRHPASTLDDAVAWQLNRCGDGDLNEMYESKEEKLRVHLEGGWAIFFSFLF